MKIFPIASGSTGNCTYIESAHHRILLDVGISTGRIQAALATVGRSLTEIDAIFLTHAHHDHIAALPVLTKKVRIPIWTTQGTYGQIKAKLPKAYPVEVIASDAVLAFDQLRIETYAIPHDCVEPVVFVFDGDGKRYGHFTDLGAVPDHIRKLLPNLDALVLESNYDPLMLREGPYPWPLKKRISGGRGHLSNDIAVDMAAHHISDRLQYLVLGHLSQNNNTPAKVLESFLPLKKIHAQLKLGIARPEQPTQIMVL